MKMNHHYGELKASYLFVDIAHKVAAYQEAHPEKEIIRLFFARPLCVLLGADGTTLPHAIPYISILLMFSPLFLCNNLLN